MFGWELVIFVFCPQTACPPLFALFLFQGGVWFIQAGLLVLMFLWFEAKLPPWVKQNNNLSNGSNSQNVNTQPSWAKQNINQNQISQPPWAKQNV